MTGVVVSTCEAYTRLHGPVLEATAPVVAAGVPVVFSSAGHSAYGWDRRYAGVTNVSRMRLPYNAFDCSWMVDLAAADGILGRAKPDVGWWLHLHDTMEFGPGFPALALDTLAVAAARKPHLTVLSWHAGAPGRMQFFVGVYAAAAVRAAGRYFASLVGRSKEQIVSAELMADGRGGVQGQFGVVDWSYWEHNRPAGREEGKFGLPGVRDGVYLPHLDVTKWYRVK